MSAINGRLLNIPNVNDFKKHLDTLDDKTAALTEKDADLQAQIDRIEDRTNLVDIVATYAELQDYDTSILSADDVIEVLHDETQNEATTYYRWVILAGGEKRWELIGLTGPYVSLHAEETIDAHKTFTAGITANAIDGLSTPTANDQAANKQYVDNFFVDKATEQIVTGVKHFKADNTALENLGVYSNETILEKATKIKVGGSDAFNIDAEADYTNFWKLTSFLGTTKIAVNDTQAVNFIAYEADSFLEKPTTFKINGNNVLKTSAEDGGKAIFDKPVDFRSLVYAGGHEIRFPEYVEFKDNTAAHNTVLRVDQNFIDANKVITAKQGINIDVTPTEAQHAVRKDYVDNKPNLIKIAWSELKALRDNSKLIPGRFYRITDYECTTAQADTQSAGHVFDIIVRADSENKLNEEASAIQHWDDTYFANNKLEAWKLWYCLDNDADRFAWADSTNGKGVIYRMIDEFGNDCPYDFKNIQFKRKINLTNGYPTYDETDGTEMWCYTFTATSYNIDADTWSSLKDGSLESPAFHMSDDTMTFKDNKIEKYIMVYNSDEDYTKCGKEYLSNNVFLGYYEEVGTSSEEHSYYYACCCFNNKLGYNCYNNTFGNNCGSNTFGDNCYSNTLGNSCDSNTLGNSCRYTIFGTRSGSTNTSADYYQNNIIDNGCSYLCLNANGTAGYSNLAQNIHVHLGVTGTSSEYKTITVERNLPYTTDVYPIGSTEMFI